MDKYYCSGVNIASTVYVCPNGCSNGYCLPAICSSSQVSCGSICCNSGLTCDADYQCAVPQSNFTKVNPISCSDGTLVGQCSTSRRPYFCNNQGVLSQNCPVCGCPPHGSACPASGTCGASTSCPDGTLVGYCSKDQPYYCVSDGTLIERAGACGCSNGYIASGDSCIYKALIISVNSPTDQATYSTNPVLFNITATTGGNIFQCFAYVDSNVYYAISNEAGTNYYSVNQNLPDGPHTVYFYCDDSLGQTFTTPTLTFNVKYVPPIPSIGINKKDSSLYTPKMTFLVSDAKWEDVLPMVSATTWTDSNGNIKEYPLLVFHNEVSSSGWDSFDADSALYFMRQSSPDKLMIIGSTPSSGDLEAWLTASATPSADAQGVNYPLGAGLQQDQIQRIYTEDYIDYWSSFSSVVYVEDNYTLGLLASTYASLINAPLVIQGSNLDNSNTFFGRDIICVGDVSPPAGNRCSETYTLAQLQSKYVQKTGTDKLIVVNPSDFAPREVVYYYSTNASEQSNFPLYFVPSTGDGIYQIYTKTSLIAPILASSKHELLVSVDDERDIDPNGNYYDLGTSDHQDYSQRYYTSDYQNSYTSIGNFIHSQLSGMNYLTIMASPYAIPIFEPKPSIFATSEDFNPITILGLDFIGAGDSLDPHYYADTNGDGTPDVAVGRIAGMSTSDVSSYVARDLFLTSFPKNNNAKFMGSSFSGILATMVKNINSYFQNSGYNSVAVTSSDTQYKFSPNEWLNQGLIYYADHGGYWWAGINSYEIPNLDNSLVVAAACDTVSSQSWDSFWSNALRQGAIGFMGAVSTTSFDTSTVDFISSIYYDENNLGNAFKDSYSSGVFQNSMTLYWRSYS